MKQVILLFIVISLSLAGFSQPHTRLSFVADPSVNWMRTNNSSQVGNGKSSLGYDFGLNADYYFSDDERYAIATGIQITNVGGELNYHPTAGFKFSGINLTGSPKIKYQLRYIEIPFSVKLRTDEFNRAYYWGLLGFSGMLNIGSKGTSNDGVMNKAAIGDEVNMFNIAMNVGVGFDYDLGRSNSLTMGLIFQNGLIDVTTDNAFTDKTIINSLRLKLGLIF